jgi:hypothetical protein
MLKVHRTPPPIENPGYANAVHGLLAGKSYVKTPESINANKKAMVNVKNKDEKCFQWAKDGEKCHYI